MVKSTCTSVRKDPMDELFKDYLKIAALRVVVWGTVIALVIWRLW